MTMKDTTKIPLSSLSPCEYNPRKISKKRLDRLVASIKTHTTSLEGWDCDKGYRLASTVTVNRNGNRIVGGHQRIEALLKLGQDWIHEKDVTWINLEPGCSQEKALNVSLNDDKSGGSWDKDKLGELLGSLKESDSGLYSDLSFDTLSASLEEAGSKDDVNDSLKKEREEKLLVTDNVSFIVQEVLAKYGETVPNGFIFFAHKNKLHLLVQCDDTTYEMTKAVAEGLKRDNKSINQFLFEVFQSGIALEKWEGILSGVIGRAYEPVSPGDLTEDAEEK